MSGIWVGPEPGLTPGLWPWPGWALAWFAQAGLACLSEASCPRDIPILHTNVLEEFVSEASRAATAHEMSNPSVRKFRKDSFWRLREGMRPREFPTFPSVSVARIRF